MILLYHETAVYGMIATNGEPVAGEPAPPRRYHHEGNFVAIEGPGHIVEHDVADILGIAGYRLATAEEQEEYFRKKRREHSIHEQQEPEYQKEPEHQSSGTSHHPRTRKEQ